VVIEQPATIVDESAGRVGKQERAQLGQSLLHISEPTRLVEIS
jgi:hypothetical protein